MIKTTKPKLIGRTRVNIDNYDVSLSIIDYFRIENMVKDFIIANEINELPVDLIEIAYKNDWIIMPYSKIVKQLAELYEEIMYTDWGFTILFNGKYMIFYDDTIKLSAQRFTIAHEVGHIVLQHLLQSDATTREMEANLFASKLLMPLEVLKACKIDSKEEIVALCGVSFLSASYRFEKINFESCGKTNNHDKKDIIIKEQFSQFIKTYLDKKYSQFTY